MKNIFILCLILASAGKTFSQADTTTPYQPIKADYLKKSKTQKTVAWVLLGAGTAMTIGGVIAARNGVDDSDPNETLNGAALIVGGIALDITSIPFFIASSKNKQRALTVTLRNEPVPTLVHGGVLPARMPSINLIVKL